MLGHSLTPSEPFFYDPQQSFISRLQQGFVDIYLPNVLYGLAAQCQLLSVKELCNQSGKWLSLLKNSHKNWNRALNDNGGINSLFINAMNSMHAANESDR